MKALIVKIKDAGIFNNMKSKKDGTKYSETKDKIVDIEGIKDRTEFFEVNVDTFYYKHVANLIRVLFGERPVPSFRKVHDIFVGDNSFEEKAKKSRVKIETEIFPIDEYHADPYFLDETFTANRAFESYGKHYTSYTLDNEDVFVKGGTITKDRLRIYLGNLIDDYDLLIKSLGGAITTKNEIELLNKNKENEKVVEFCKKCVENKLKLFTNIINNKQDKGAPKKQIAFDIHSRRNQNNMLNLLFVSKSVERIKRVSGVIYIPIEDNEIEKIRNGTGVATFLEGGLATVEDIVDWNEFIELDSNEIML
jgi:hypothetical protein